MKLKQTRVLLFGFFACFLALLPTTTFAQVQLTDSLRNEGIKYRIKQIDQTIHKLAQNGSLEVFKGIHSEYPMSLEEINDLGQLQFAEADTDNDSSSQKTSTTFNETYFEGLGFKRRAKHDFRDYTSSIQLEYVSVLYQNRYKGMKLSTTSFYYIPINKLQAALTQKDYHFLLAVNVMAINSSTFHIQTDYITE